MRFVSLFSFLALLALAAGTPSLAHADGTPEAKAKAQAAVKAGNKLLADGKNSEALAKFQEAYRIYPSPKIHYNLGQAQSVIPGHETAAYEEMSAFLTEATDAAPALRIAAEEAKGKLRSKIGLVKIHAEPKTATLFVDGQDTGTVPNVLVLGIGAHALVIKADGASSTTTTATIKGGESLNLDLKVHVPTAPPPVAVAALPPPKALTPAKPAASSVDLSATQGKPPAAEGDNESLTGKWWFWTAAGTLVAATAIVIITASGSKSETKQTCVSGTASGCQGI